MNEEYSNFIFKISNGILSHIPGIYSWNKNSNLNFEFDKINNWIRQARPNFNIESNEDEIHVSDHNGKEIFLIIFDSKDAPYTIILNNRSRIDHKSFYNFSSFFTFIYLYIKEKYPASPMSKDDWDQTSYSCKSNLNPIEDECAYRLGLFNIPYKDQLREARSIRLKYAIEDPEEDIMNSDILDSLKDYILADSLKDNDIKENEIKAAKKEVLIQAAEELLRVWKDDDSVRQASEYLRSLADVEDDLLFGNK